MEPGKLGKYEIRGTLGKGAMGTVYAGWDPVISRKVAIKTVRLPDASDIDAQEELQRFKREAQAAGRLTHPNIVGIFDYGETAEVAYIVMEFVDGQTLKSLLDAGERLAVTQVGHVMADVLAGLSYSHERGVVHRDIKPANIMIVGGDGHGSGRAKIADFGIARIESSNLTQAGTIMGTPAYMSPEQFMGQTVDARTDLYSCGVLLFQLLTGDRPFEGSMATIMHKVLNTVPPKPSELSVTAPRSLDAVVMKAMARRPEDRYANASAFAASLAAALERPAATAGLGPGLDDLETDATVISTFAPRPAAAAPPPPPSATATAAAPAKSRVPALLGAGVVALALAGGGAWFALSGGNGETKVVDATPTAPPAPVPVARIEPPVTPPPISLPPPASPPPSAPVSQPLVTATPTTLPDPVPAAPDPHPTVTQVVPPTAPTPAATAQASTDGPARLPQPAQIIPPTMATPTTPTAVEEPRTRPNAITVPVQPAQVSPPPSGTAAAPVVAEASRPPAPTSPGLAPAPPAIAPAPQPELVPVQPTASPSSTPAIAPAATPVIPPPTPSNPPAPQTAPTVTASAGLAPDSMRQALLAAVRGAECAVVGGDVSRNSGLVTVRGAVGRGRPEQELLRNVREAVPTAALDWAIGVAEGPYCGVLNLVRSYARPFGASSGGIEVGLKDNRTNLVADERVDIVTTGPDFPGYLQVDYFAGDGSVTHLRSAVDGSPVLPARSQQDFYAGDVAFPFGTDLIVAIAAGAPLFAKDRPQTEKIDPYLRDLRTALETANRRKTQVAASVIMVRTSPRP